MVSKKNNYYRMKFLFKNIQFWNFSKPIFEIFISTFMFSLLTPKGRTGKTVCYTSRPMQMRINRSLVGARRMLAFTNLSAVFINKTTCKHKLWKISSTQLSVSLGSFVLEVNKVRLYNLKWWRLNRQFNLMVYSFFRALKNAFLGNRRLSKSAACQRHLGGRI